VRGKRKDKKGDDGKKWRAEDEEMKRKWRGKWEGNSMGRERKREKRRKV